MDFVTSDIINHPPDVVLAAFRDRLPEVAALIPDIKSITVISREEVGNTTKLHNLWEANREIPKALSKFLSPDMLKWDDYAEYFPGESRCTWRIELPAFSGAVDCFGSNHYKDLGDGRTELEMTGSLSLDLSKVPKIPRLLKRTLGPQVEKFVVALIQPNLSRTNQAVARLLASG